MENTYGSWSGLFLFSHIFATVPLTTTLSVPNQSSKKGQIGRPRLAQQTRAARPKFCKGCRCRLQAAYQQPLAAIANDGGGKAHIDP